MRVDWRLRVQVSLFVVQGERTRVYVCMYVGCACGSRQSGAGAAGIRMRTLASRPEIFLGYMKFYDLNKHILLIYLIALWVWANILSGVLSFKNYTK